MSRLEDNSFLYFCPGCKNIHAITVRGDKAWNFNFDLEFPTLSPSVLAVSPNLPRCHHFLRGGILDFCDDSEHELAGKMVTLPDGDPFRLLEAAHER